MKMRIWISLVVPATSALMLLGACRDSFEDCENTGTCPAGDSGGGGNTATGGSSAEAGGPGDGDTGGTGGTVTPDPCDKCTAPTPACNAAEECVECTDADTSACDGTDTPVCVGETCVQCADNFDCTEPGASVCQSGACVACANESNDCEHLEDTPFCNGGTCVECTPSNYSACGVDTDNTGDPFVCDALTNTCSSTATEGGASLCQSCISNAHCLPGQACVVQRFAGEDVGAFCFYVKNGGNGAPAECFPAGRPYVDELSSQRTLDGTTADICGLRATTCPALRDYSSLDCAPGGTPNNDLCGAEGLSDGYCKQINPSAYRCTVPCGSADDCKTGFACETGTPELCAL